jgi:hypothetical protein
MMLANGLRKNSAILGLTSLAAFAVAGLAAVDPAAAASATNPYLPSNGHSYRHGAVPTREQHAKIKDYAAKHQAAIAAIGSQTLSFGGGVNGIGVTSGTPKVYLVFWGTQWGTQSTDGNGNLVFSSDTAGGAGKLQQMFKGLGTGNELWSGLMTQYCDGSLVSSGARSCPAGAPHVGYPTGGNLSGVW